MSTDENSQDSIMGASRSRAKFSGHGAAKGAAGYRVAQYGDADCEHLSVSGQSAMIDPPLEGFGDFVIGAAWDNIEVQQSGFFGKLLKKATKQGIDIDLGCLYELHDGQRGALQAFGDLYGRYEQAPWIYHSGDEKTGNAEGDDEYFKVNGAFWKNIKRILVYVYIYDGDGDWATIKPSITLRIPGSKPMIVNPDVHKANLPVCVIAGLENIRGGIKLENFTEYFPGHSEMDRAHGFGLQWDEGTK